LLQGILLLLVGLLILARHAAWARRALDRLKITHPRAAEMIDKAQATADRWADRAAVGAQGFWRRLVGR
jgi:hypothetical protein